MKYVFGGSNSSSPLGLSNFVVHESGQKFNGICKWALSGLLRKPDVYSEPEHQATLLLASTQAWPLWPRLLALVQRHGRTGQGRDLPGLVPNMTLGHKSWYGLVPIAGCWEEAFRNMSSNINIFIISSAHKQYLLLGTVYEYLFNFGPPGSYLHKHQENHLPVGRLRCPTHSGSWGPRLDILTRRVYPRLDLINITEFWPNID